MVSVVIDRGNKQVHSFQMERVLANAWVGEFNGLARKSGLGEFNARITNAAPPEPPKPREVLHGLAHEAVSS